MDNTEHKGSEKPCAPPDYAHEDIHIHPWTSSVHVVLPVHSTKCHVFEGKAWATKWTDRKTGKNHGHAPLTGYRACLAMKLGMLTDPHREFPRERGQKTITDPYHHARPPSQGPCRRRHPQPLGSLVELLLFRQTVTDLSRIPVRSWRQPREPALPSQRTHSAVHRRRRQFFFH